MRIGGFLFLFILVKFFASGAFGNLVGFDFNLDARAKCTDMLTKGKKREMQS
jgi:hypothetical protein